MGWENISHVNSVRNLKGYWICKKSITRTKYTSNRLSINLFISCNKCTCIGNGFKRISIHITTERSTNFQNDLVSHIYFISPVRRYRRQLSITSGLTILFSGFKSYNLTISSLQFHTSIFREYATEYHFSQKEIFQWTLNHWTTVLPKITLHFPYPTGTGFTRAILQMRIRVLDESLVASQTFHYDTHFIHSVQVITVVPLIYPKR